MGKGGVIIPSLLFYPLFDILFLQEKSEFVGVETLCKESKICF